MNWAKRVRNYGMWMSIVALFLMVVEWFGVAVVTSTFEDLYHTILVVLVLLGIINNPASNNQGYGD